jgi:hypothetical protein
MPMSFDPTKLDLLDCGLYISYMNYYATGEGVTSCVAVGGSLKYVEDVLKKHIDEYFHRVVQTVPLDREMNEDARSMLARVPDEVKDSLRRMPQGAGHYFSEFYYNLA